MAGGESTLLSSGHVPNIAIRLLAFMFMPLLVSIGVYATLLVVLAVLVPSGFVGAFALFVLLFCVFAIYVYDPHNQLITTKDGKSIPQMILHPKAKD